MSIAWVAFFVLFAALSVETVIGTINTSPLSHSAILDANNKYHVAWDYDAQDITFEVSVETRGYIGLGFSPNGQMAGSDIVIGWVDDSTGSGKISDRHAIGTSEPLIDEIQDYTLLSSSQNDSHTVLRINRKLQLCGDEDHHITDETVRLIWAFNDADPTSGGSALYHGTNRGNKNMYLLNPQRVKPPIPANVIYKDFLNLQVTIPSASTTYWCQSFPVPQLDRKHHVIKVEPIIQSGHESEVHHILLYACYHQVSNASIAVGHECYHPNMPDGFKQCTSVTFGWAVGGGSMYLPENVGIPLGYEGDPNMLLMETHYDNPTGKLGLIDSSGFRLTLTADLREHDAGIFEVGQFVSRMQIIPPHSDSFRTSGQCYPECLTQAMETQPQGIKIISTMLHSHLLGHAMRVRHFRQGVEQPLLVEDNSYDFNFQEYHFLEKEVEIKSGDHFVTECDYRSKGRTEITHGGLSTQEEMCLAFLFYYPKIKLGTCLSTPVPQLIAGFLSATIDDNNVITGPPVYAGRGLYDVLNKDVDWTIKDVRDKYQNLIDTENVGAFYVICIEGDYQYPVHGTVTSLPKKTSTLAKPQTCGGYQGHVSGFLLFLALSAVFIGFFL